MRKSWLTRAGAARGQRQLLQYTQNLAFSSIFLAAIVYVPYLSYRLVLEDLMAQATVFTSAKQPTPFSCRGVIQATTSRHLSD